MAETSFIIMMSHDDDDGRHDSASKVKPKRLDHPQLVGLSSGQTLLLLKYYYSF